MNRLPSILYGLVVTCCIHGTIVNGSKSDDFLREDLADIGEGDLSEGNYEIVKFQHRNVKSGSGNRKEFRFRRSGQNVTIVMKETSVIRTETPIWLIYSPSKIVRADKNVITDAVRLYENRMLYWSIVSTSDEHGHLYFVGNIDRSKVAPLSKRSVRSLLEEKPHLFEDQTWDNGTEDFQISDYHVLYTPKLPENEKVLLSAMGSLGRLKQRPVKYSKTSYDRLKRSTADTIYPEVTVILDYNQTYTTTREFRFMKLIIYTISFWNSVNLRFSTLKNPKVQLRLTGIVVNMERKGLPFITDFMQHGMLSLAVNWFSVAHMSDIISELSYDILIIQTSLTICQQTREGDCKNNHIVGSALRGPDCHNVISAMAAVIHDDMNYSGIHVAAHEIGHTLGAVHDTGKSSKCNDEDGYIMSGNYRYNDRGFEWSQCSKERLSSVLRSKVGDCLDNDIPNVPQGELVDHMLWPGKDVSENELCEKRGYPEACESADVCQNLSCLQWWIFCTDTGPAYDGFSCPGGECRNGKCVAKKKKQLTDEY